MSTTDIAPVIAPITPAMIDRVSSAYVEGNSTLVARVRALHAVLSAGHTVKGLHAAMLSAHVIDPSIDVQSTTTYGFAAAAATVAASIPGLPFGKVPAADLALYARAAKHVKVGPFKAAVRNVVNNMADDAGADTILIALRDMCETAVSVIRDDHRKAAEKSRAEAERAARNAGGTGSGDDDGDADDAPATSPAPAPAPRATVTAASVLASIHAATAFIRDNGTPDADMINAVALLTAALSDARKRTPIAA